MPEKSEQESTETGLEELGWAPFYQQQMLDVDDANQLPARVLAVHRSVIRVAGAGFEIDLPAPINLVDGPIAVGDWLLLDAGRERILRILERSSVFRRRAPGTESREQLIAANVDTLFVVSSCNQDFNVARL